MHPCRNQSKATASSFTIELRPCVVDRACQLLEFGDVGVDLVEVALVVAVVHRAVEAPGVELARLTTLISHLLLVCLHWR